MRRFIKRRRRGTVLEQALVSMVLLTVIFGTIVGGLGVVRYFQLASVAREAARWAAVHGATYHEDTGRAVATEADVYNTVIEPRAGLLHLADLTYTVTWDDAGKEPLYYDAATDTHKRNQVHVQLTYVWRAEMLLGTHTFTTDAREPMSY
jgi:Flp pilus assembly protein TadG